MMLQINKPAMSAPEPDPAVAMELPRVPGRGLRILFALRHPSYLRNFMWVVEALASEGHSVHLVFHMHGPLGEDTLVQELKSKNFNITAQYIDQDIDAVAIPWSKFARQVRCCLDFLRYAHPRYRGADALRARARKRAPAWIQRLGDQYLSRSKLGLELVLRAGCSLEWAFPPHPVIERIVEVFRPDVVLATPVVDMGSAQGDWFKVSRIRGIPSVLPVTSWDNLTNKGRLKVRPDRILVWNAAQRSEAVTFHAAKPRSVAVCGAWSYEHWFGWKPALGRAVFLRRVGLDPSKRFILYVGSSPFIAPEETGFCRRLIEALRAYEPTRDIGVLIRPHPQNAPQWEALGEAGLSDVAVYPKAGANPINAGLQNDYFDSIWHSEAVFGINTSAQVEAGVIGRPVLTVTDESFSETQTGTLHFHHLTRVNGGLLHVAGDVREHAVLLDRLLAQPPQERCVKSRRFTQSFIRPHGLDRAVVPIVIAELKAAASICPPSARAPLLLGRVLRAVLLRRFARFRVGEKSRELVQAIALPPELAEDR